MNTKAFIISGLIGGIVNWLLGWLFYGILFKDFFPPAQETTDTMVFILLGCLAMGFFIAYIYAKWAQISTFKTGATAGLAIGLFMGLIANFFSKGMDNSIGYDRMGIDIAISLVMTAVVGGVIGALIGKFSPKAS